MYIFFFGGIRGLHLRDPVAVRRARVDLRELLPVATGPRAMAVQRVLFARGDTFDGVLAGDQS